MLKQPYRFGRPVLSEVQFAQLAPRGFQSRQAVETADLGRRVEDGFEVLGRAPGAEARGCSIAADAMLASSA